MTNTDTQRANGVSETKATGAKTTGESQLHRILPRRNGANIAQIQLAFAWQPYMRRRQSRRCATPGLSGSQPFNHGHIHHILSNPIYTGRIRHNGKVYEGQHPAIINPEIWEQVQKALEGGAARTRGSKLHGTRSPLAGKLFDETGDRLTPSHSQKNGKRLRYYISRRLVTDRSRQQPDAWRLSADQVEGLLSG